MFSPCNRNHQSIGAALSLMSELVKSQQSDEPFFKCSFLLKKCKVFNAPEWLQRLNFGMRLMHELKAHDELLKHRRRH